MKILLTGASGQIGHALLPSLQALGQVVPVERARMDLADLDQVRAVLRTERPQLIVNTAAYTAVDQAEAEPALAQRINADAPALMAAEARALGAALVHFSTDYVFDGAKTGAYLETDPPNPLSVYGRSKLAGEQAVAAAGIGHLIVRTSWVYGLRRHNFLMSILRAARQRDSLEVVSDQVGTPSWSRAVADATVLALQGAASGGPAWWARHGGLYHVAGGGQASRAAFAEEIIARAGLACRVVPVATGAYPAVAKRPANSVLDCAKWGAAFGPVPHWRESLALCLA